MRPLRYCCLAIALFFPAVLYAGQIYGSVFLQGRALANATIEINCAGAVTRGSTAADGSYRVSVPQQGQCSLTLPAYSGPPSAIVFSNPNPSAYNFELVQRQDGHYELRRR
jgi:hypothetical protein